MTLARWLYTVQRYIKNRWRYHFQVPKQPFTASECPLLECDTGELGQFVWQRLLPIVGPKPFPPHELMLMGAAMLWLRPQMIVEWGTNVGVSARVFHELNVHYRIGAEIHSIDLPDGTAHREAPHRLRGILAWGLPVTLHQGDGPIVASTLLREKACQAPLVFIDGDHERDSVLRDAHAILEVAPEAGLLFHDTFYQPTSSYNHGPHEAVQEILMSVRGPAQVIEVGLGCPGMTFVLPAALP